MHRPSPAPFLALLFALLPLSACERGEAGPPDLDALPEVEAEERFRAGSLDDPTYSLTFVSNGTIGADGRIYTLHGQEQRIRIFDPEGTLLGSFGGAGDGPGEFRQPSRMGWRADSLWVFDINGSRFSFFSPEGDFQRSFQVPFVMSDPDSPIPPPRADRLLSDGSVLGSVPAFSHLVAQGIITDHIYLRMEPTGEVGPELLRFPMGRNQWSIGDPNAPRGPTTFTSQPWADGHMMVLDPTGEVAVLLDRRVGNPGEPHGFRLTWVALGGDSLRHREYHATAIPLLDDEVEERVNETLERLGSFGMMAAHPAPQLRRWALQTLYRPHARPAVALLQMGDDGFLWVREGNPEEGWVTWLRISPEGDPLLRTRLPSSFRMFAANGERLWGSVVDDLEVPYLVSYQVPEP